jgi:hypothetical protein
MRWPPPGSLADHLERLHGYDVGRTIDDASHRRDHAYHDRAVVLLRAVTPPTGPAEVLAARLSWVLPVGHPYEPLTDFPA